MTKTELIEAVVCATGVKKSLATAIVAATFETITSELEKGNKVFVSNFGTFEVHERKERVGMNPSTKEKIVIPASKAPAFKAGKALKDRVK